MSEHPGSHDVRTLRAIVLKAGRLLVDGRSEMTTIDFKSATDMVTDLDRRAEALLVEELARAFPDDAIAAEEGSTRPGSSGFRWLIDPLDGTTNYVHGHPYYAVSAARLDGQGPCLSIVHAPALDELWTAVRGAGLPTLERPSTGGVEAVEPLGTVALDRALLGTGFPYERGEVCARNCDAVKRLLLSPCHGVRRAGSAALDLCHVGGGRLDGYWEHSLRPWDVAGGALVAAQAGAKITDMSGGDDWLDGRHILAAHPALHEELRIILGEEFEGLI